MLQPQRSRPFQCASAYPTAGGMYHWVYILTESVWACWTLCVPPAQPHALKGQSDPFASRLPPSSGWMELLGQIASVSAVAFVWAVFVQEVILLATSNDPHGQSMIPSVVSSSKVDIHIKTQEQLFGLYSGVLLASGILNSIHSRVLEYLAVLCAWFCLLAIAVIVIVVPCVAPTHQSAHWVFTAWVPKLGAFYLGEEYTPAYSAMLALLLPAYNFTCYDGPAHLSEELKDASRAAPRAILVAILSSAITGWVLVISMCFSIQSLDSTLAYTSDYNGNAPGLGLNSPAQIMWDAFKARYNKPMLGNMLMFMPVVATFFCTVSLVTFVSRILFAYSRDRAVPLSGLWFRVDSRTGLPLTSVWGTVFMAEILGIAILRDNYAINAILSLSVIALNVVYIIPSILRLTVGRKRFRPGPFTLGKWAYATTLIGTVWVGFAVCIFSLPQVYPVNYRTLNYAGICWLATLFASQIAYFAPVVGARKWFRGPADETNIRDWLKQQQPSIEPRA
jgi:amino acid transporter